MDIFHSTAETLLVRGGANAGKTYSIVDKLFIQAMVSEKPLKCLVLRKTFPALRNSVVDIMTTRAESWGLQFNLNKSEWVGTINNMKFVFLSLNNQEDYIKVRSMTDIDFIWVNEITDIREYDYDVLMTRLRGGQGDYSQFIGDFNPTGKTSWLYKRFYSSMQDESVDRLKYNVLDNPWATEREIDRLTRTKETNKNFYNIYFKGEWGELEGLVYNWDVVSLPEISFDEVFYGLDFGYSIDPAAVVRIYRKSNEYWLEEVLYKTGLTNKYLAVGLRNKVLFDPVSPIYCDSAEPKSIDELRDYGLNPYPASKGKDSVHTGIDFLKSQKIHIVEGSENLLKEHNSYVYMKDKDGNLVGNGRPIDFNNHLMDAVRYGIYTHNKNMNNGVWFGSIN